MNITYNPLSYLLAFIVLVILLYFMLRPGNGFWHQLLRYLKFNDRIVLEDVLKYLYKNTLELKACNSVCITENLTYSQSKIKHTLGNMESSGLIAMDDKTVVLSEVGNEYALRILRAHRLWERYLAEKTGYDSKDWHDIAEVKEHELDEHTVTNLSSLLGNPLYDPHGKPIPPTNGRMDFLETVPLSNLPINTKARIVNIQKTPLLVYDQIVAENIHIGALVRIVESTSNRIVFHSENKEFILSPAIAKNIILNVLSVDTRDDKNLMVLSELKINEKATILGLSKECRGENRRRLLDLGFVPSSEVAINLLNPLGDPTSFLIKGASIALRKKQASKVFIKIIKDGQ